MSKRENKGRLTKERAETIGRETRFKPGNTAAVKWSAEDKGKLLDAIANGAMNTEACSAPGAPPYYTFMDWLDDPAFKARYREACRARAQVMLERSLVETQQSKPKANTEVNRQRLAFDKLRYYLSVTTQGEFSDRVTQHLVGREDGPIQTVSASANVDDPIEAARIYQRIISGG